ncbi:MAG TPA: rhodanese-like domain-containing protein [Humisphaera sp.]
MSVRTISPRDLFALRQQGKGGDFIDVRTPAEYAEVHAEGTRSVPVSALDPATVVAGRKGPAGEPIYVICKAGGRSAAACKALAAAGVADVVSVEGGTDAWAAAWLPVVRGPRKAMSIERQVRIAAGALVLTGVVLGRFVHPAFLGLSAFVGAGLVFAGVTDWCGMGLLLARAPWNR